MTADQVARSDKQRYWAAASYSLHYLDLHFAAAPKSTHPELAWSGLQAGVAPQGRRASNLMNAS